MALLTGWYWTSPYELHSRHVGTQQDRGSIIIVITNKLISGNFFFFNGYSIAKHITHTWTTFSFTFTWNSTFALWQLVLQWNPTFSANDVESILFQYELFILQMETESKTVQNSTFTLKPICQILKQWTVSQFKGHFPDLLHPHKIKC